MKKIINLLLICLMLTGCVSKDGNIETISNEKVSPLEGCWVKNTEYDNIYMCFYGEDFRIIELDPNTIENGIAKIRDDYKYNMVGSTTISDNNIEILFENKYDGIEETTAEYFRGKYSIENDELKISFDKYLGGWIGISTTLYALTGNSRDEISNASAILIRVPETEYELKINYLSKNDEILSETTLGDLLNEQPSSDQTLLAKNYLKESEERIIDKELSIQTKLDEIYNKMLKSDSNSNFITTAWSSNGLFINSDIEDNRSFTLRQYVENDDLIQRIGVQKSNEDWSIVNTCIVDYTTLQQVTEDAFILNKEIAAVDFVETFNCSESDITDLALLKEKLETKYSELNISREDIYNYLKY